MVGVGELRFASFWSQEEAAWEEMWVKEWEAWEEVLVLPSDSMLGSMSASCLATELALNSVP